MKTLIGIFDDPAQARRAMDELQGSELKLEDISIVSPQVQEAQAEAERVSAGEGATIGAVWGGLVGLAALLIPGVGPFVVGGAMLAAMTGAATGAIMGSIAGALMRHTDLSEQEALEYEQLVHSGKVLLAIKTHDADADAARRILAQAGASSIRDNQTDVTGSSAPVRVESTGFTSWSGEKDLAPGGAVVRGNVDVPATPSASPVLRPAGLSGIYDVPYATNTIASSSEAATSWEVNNIAAGAEDAYGTEADGHQSGAIVTEGWEQIGTFNEREDKEAPADDKDGTREASAKRRDRSA